MIDIKLPRRGQSALANEIQKLLRFIDPQVEQVTVVDPQTVSVQMAADAGTTDERVASLRRIVTDYVSGYKDFRPAKLAEGRHPASACACPHELENPEVAYGVRCKSGTYLDLERFVVMTFARLFGRHGPYRMAVPSMISREVVERVGYFKKFPNLANFVVNLRKDYELFKSVSNGTVDLTGGNLLNEVEASDKMLNPVTCYHVYPQANQLIGATGRTSFAIEGSTYRFESHNMDQTRLNEFHITELVFFGSKDQVIARRMEILQQVLDLLDRWQIDFFAETSSDVFYSADAGTYMATQRHEQAKIEVNGRTDKGHHSFLSLNLHGTFYTDLYSIKVDDVGQAYSGCVGCGVERFIYVIHSQHGQDPTQWPEALRDDFARFADAWGANGGST